MSKPNPLELSMNVVCQLLYSSTISCHYVVRKLMSLVMSAEYRILNLTTSYYMLCQMVEK